MRFSDHSISFNTTVHLFNFYKMRNIIRQGNFKNATPPNMLTTCENYTDKIC